MGKDITAEELQKQFDRVILACGASNPRDIKVPGRDSKKYLLCSGFPVFCDKEPAGFRICRRGHFISAKGKHVLVIGGGDTGNDCVGTAIRLGAKSVTQLEMMPKPSDRATAKSNPWPEWPQVLKDGLRSGRGYRSLRSGSAESIRQR